MKFLILRFSSIGDIVLTTPVVRILANAGHTVHFITKSKFSSVLLNNPHINKLYTFQKEIKEIEDQLIAEDYDYIIDLHNNLRTKRLIIKLKKPVRSFNKLNYEKWLKVNLKLDILPPVHIVKRYLDTISIFDLKYDRLGLDYFLTEEEESIFDKIDISKSENYIVFTVGGAHATKQIPQDQIIKIGKQVNNKIVLLGGADDKSKADEVTKAIGDNCVNLSGKLNLNQSAAVVKYANKVLTADTGLMHIAAAFDRNILAVWGNTIPEFGMSALLPTKSTNFVFNAEVKDLKCRPCSKIGYAKCPKKNFKCMQDQNLQLIVNILN